MSNNFDNRDKYDLIDQGFIIISTVGDLLTCEIPLGYSKNIIDYFYEVIMHKCLNKEENRDR